MNWLFANLLYFPSLSFTHHESQAALFSASVRALRFPLLMFRFLHVLPYLASLYPILLTF